MEMTKREFDIFSKDCDKKDGWKCKKTGYACKDYMCHKLKEEQPVSKPSRTIEMKPPCRKCDNSMAIEVLIKIHKKSMCPKCGRDLVVLK